MSGNDVVRLPEVIVFAGPNGSSKSTITRDIYYRWSNQYWSNDDIKKLSGIAEFANESIGI